VVHAEALGFFLPGAGFQPGDGVLVADGPGPARYIVQTVTDFGPDWDTRVELHATQEVFG
jgi:hypothetical protein